MLTKACEHEQGGLERSMAIEKAIEDCIGQGILTEYLSNNASEVSNMLLQEWNLEDAKIVWQREAREDGLKDGLERGEKLGMERSDQKWKSVIADKDALIAELQARLEKSN
jgi:flagellar biosynthesis/type III secretory pathway protein FliH